jgi:hypothetical protein
MTELHNTLMGRRLIEHDIPEIHTQLKRIADALESKNKPETEYIEFIETLEALTTDTQTAKRIRKFLTDKNIWKPLAKL